MPPASSLQARRRMQSTRQRDTIPEIAIRRVLHARGFRYRVDRPVIPGLRRRADLVFSGPKVAVFVDGCFWHSCPRHGTRPKANAKWWASKLETNRRRDSDTNRRLRASGWRVVRVWEHETPAKAADRVATAVNSRNAIDRT